MTRRHLAWLAVLVVVAGALTIGVVEGREPRTEQDRVEAIAKTIRCPVCTTESVFESRSASAEDIRREITEEVRAGRSADQVRASIAARYGGTILLEPPAEGVGALVWVLPVAVAVLAVAGLALAFRRWQSNARRLPKATEADAELVARARSTSGANPSES